MRNGCSVRRAGRGRPRLPGRGGWGETERRKTLIAHLKKEAAHLGFRHLACRDGEGIRPENDGFREIPEIADPGEGACGFSGRRLCRTGNS